MGLPRAARGPERPGRGAGAPPSALVAALGSLSHASRMRGRPGGCPTKVPNDRPLRIALIPSILVGMSKILDVGPLRSLVAVADCGGFQRAATALHLTQGAVSQHVRRLEAVVGRPLVERDGRGSRFTSDGEVLLREARRMLAIHDEMLRHFDADGTGTLVIGSTEHAADQMLPQLSAQLGDSFPGHRVRFRLDRSAQLRSALENGTVDLALLLSPAGDGQARDVGDLELTWYAAPEWEPPRPGWPIPVVAFGEPCALRRRALETLAGHGLPAEVVCDAAHLAGVKSAVRARWAASQTT